MAILRRLPLKPMAMAATAITAGPVRNLMAIAKTATLFPQAMIFGCNAMNKPNNHINTLFIENILYETVLL